MAQKEWAAKKNIYILSETKIYTLIEGEMRQTKRNRGTNKKYNGHELNFKKGNFHRSTGHVLNDEKGTLPKSLGQGSKFSQSPKSTKFPSHQPPFCGRGLSQIL